MKLAHCTDGSGTLTLPRPYYSVSGEPKIWSKQLPRKKTTTPDFEQSLNELETLVEQMEQGDISLEQSLELFERGIKLTRSCQESLKKAEQRVKLLVEKNGNPGLEDFAELEEEN